MKWLCMVTILSVNHNIFRPDFNLKAFKADWTAWVRSQDNLRNILKDRCKVEIIGISFHSFSLVTKTDPSLILTLLTSCLLYKNRMMRTAYNRHQCIHISKVAYL